MDINDTVRVKETGHTMQITEISEQGAYKLDNGIWYGSNEVEPAQTTNIVYCCPSKRCEWHTANAEKEGICPGCGSELVPVKE